MVTEKKETEDKKKIVYLCKHFLSRMNTLKGTQKAKRVGRGKGSGKGKTSGRGDKGQYARNQAPALRLIIKNLIRKLPKRGMAGKPVETLSLNMDQVRHLAEKHQLQSISTEKFFELLNTPKKYKKVKVIHNLSVEKIPSIHLEIDNISETAKSFIEKNGGKVIIKESK
jgi:large subunit ribosomal protein L15